MMSSTYKSISKSSIKTLFSRYCSKLEYLPYLAAAQVLPMRVNRHVIDNLIDWTKVPDDPMFRLTFPQPAMLPQTDLDLLCRKLSENTDRVRMQHIADSMRRRMNPHPGKQKEENVPILGGKRLPGMQHKYRETVLIFPSEGQFCHTYCTYCFRWAQFTAVGSSQAFSTRDRTLVTEYVRSQPQVSDVLFTGGDPMVMKAATVAEYITPLLPDSGGPPNLETIRIGTKSLAWWPERYLSDPDAGEMLDLFARTVDAGLHLTIQAHFTHPRELLDPTTQKAIRAVRSTGAMVRCQAPLMRHINDDSSTWAEMWRQQTRQGMVPYYMFVERDTGASHYFSVPLAATAQIFAAAYATVSGTSRTVRGPCMSTSAGKVCVLGDEMVAGQRVLVLQFLQARDPRWCRRVFFADYDPDAIWFDQLRPAFGEQEFFFEREYVDIRERIDEGSSGQLALGA